MRTTVDDAREEIERQWQADDAGKFWIERFPWIVSYSGGKDSTLLLSLVLDVARRFHRTAPRSVWVIFGDTGIEQEGVSARVKRNFDGLERIAQKEQIDLKTAIITPPREWSFFNVLVGRGYTAPCMPNRWCTSQIKRDPIKHWKRDNLQGDYITITGERSDESQARANRLQKNNPEDATVYKSDDARANERRYMPIRNVLTVDLWRYLDRFDAFQWGETKEELYRQYGAASVDEILTGGDNVKQRSGCRFCLAGRGANAGTNDAEREFCAWLCGYSKEIVNRNLLTLWRAEKFDDPKNEKYRRHALDEKLGIGKFTLDARREIFRRVRIMEEKTGDVWIKPEDEAFIREQWARDEREERDGGLVDARKYYGAAG